MRKEEFPTFLNEQPSVIFGRTMRELLIMLIGLTLGYLTWVQLSVFIQSTALGTIVLKVLCCLIPVAMSVAVAFINIASRPLEEWGMVGLFYSLTPRVFIYMPLDESDMDAKGIDIEKYEPGKRDSDEDDDGAAQA